MSGKLAKKYLKDYKKKAQSLLKKYFKKKLQEAKTLGKIPEKLLKRMLKMNLKGKWIRGALVTLGYEVSGGRDKKAILDASIFVEVFQTAVLIHDDIMDQDELRRGLPTIHSFYQKEISKSEKSIDSKHYGISMAINSGDLAYFLAFNKLLDSSFSKDLLIEAAKLFSRQAIKTAHGQTLDIHLTTQNIEENKLLKVLKLKTAEYSTIMPLLVGAKLGGMKDKRKIKRLEEYAIAFGWAFQIRDDLLGIFGDRESIGKPIGSDLYQGKQTLLTLYLQKKGTAEQKKLLKKFLGNPNISISDLSRIRKELKNSGSYDYVLNLGKKYVAQGEKQARKITNNPELQELLKSFIELAFERTT